MKANFAILVLISVALHVRADPLKCYRDENTRRMEMTCKQGQKCRLDKLIRNVPVPPRAYGCTNEKEEAECQSQNCNLCNTDLCNALKCYSSKEKQQVLCRLRRELCITDHITDERKCGRCEDHEHSECSECDDELCNGPPLNCYDSANKVVQCEDVQDEDGSARHKCVTILDGERVTKKCGKCSKMKLKKDDTCEECNSDKCNNQRIQPLNCYDASNQLNKCEKIRDKCITITDKVLNRVVNKMCGTCLEKKTEDDFHQPMESEREECAECDSDECNDKPVKLLNCYNSTNQANLCQSPYDNCITIMDKVSKRAVDKMCGTCPKEGSEPEERFHQPMEFEPESEKCTECIDDKCNKEHDIKLLKCQNNTNLVEECTDARDNCITETYKFYDFDPVSNKGCGRCKDKGIGPKKKDRKHGEAACADCYHDECNNEEIEEILNCYVDDDNGVKHNESCQQHGYKCMITHNRVKQPDGQWVDNMRRECGACPKNLSSISTPIVQVVGCSQCNTPLCNDFKYPKCLAGAGNAAGDFYVKNECKNFLHLKNMNVTATCIKQQVEGITYKGCGSCGAFVDYAVTKIPSVPRDANINKCHECETSESGDPCNGGILDHHMPVSFWLLLVIGACMPWLMLSTRSSFADV